MLRIRLRRHGKKKQPIYRIVVAESRAPRDGAFVESIGQYNPLTSPETFTIDEERLRHWVGNGAQPSDTIARMLVRKGIISKPGATEPTPAKPRGTATAKATAEPVEVAAPAKAKAKAPAKAEAAATPEPDAETPPTAEAETPPTTEAEPEVAAS